MIKKSLLSVAVVGSLVCLGGFILRRALTQKILHVFGFLDLPEIATKKITN